MSLILQRQLPYDPLDPRPLPGIQPLEPTDWLLVDEAYAGQMARKAEVLAQHRDAVLRRDPMADAALAELLEEVLGFLDGQPGFHRQGDVMTTPDGRHVALRGACELEVLSQLLQEDLCLMQKPEGADEHILSAALLCFPASWSLRQKYLRPLIGIHQPVEEYDATMARRVQRLFDGVQAGRPLWRFNALWYLDAELHQPRTEEDRRPQTGPEGQFLRSERQTLWRLPISGAVVFGIHTYVVRREDVLSRTP